MPNNPHSQSVKEFGQDPAQTLDRLAQTGEAELLTENGKARAVLLSPTAYEALSRDAQLSRDVKSVSTAMRELNEGKGQDAQTVSAELRRELHSLKSTKPQAS